MAYRLLYDNRAITQIQLIAPNCSVYKIILGVLCEKPTDLDIG